MEKRSRLIVLLTVVMIFAIVGCSTKNKMVNLYPAYESNNNQKKWGYINSKGDFVVEPKYNRVLDFNENGLAKVEQDGNQGIINGKGEEILEPVYQNIGEFQGGYFSAFNGKYYQLFDYEGKVQNIGSNEYIHIGKYSDGLFPVAGINENREIRYGYMDKTGKVVVDLKYNLAHGFHSGHGIVKEGSTYSVIDKSGKLVKELPFKSITETSKSEYFIYKEDGRSGIIDYRGDIVLDADFEEIVGIDGDYFGVGYLSDHGSNYGIINKNGDYLVEPSAYSILFLGENRFAVSYEVDGFGNKYSIIDEKGKVLGENYTKVGDRRGKISNGLISVSDGKETFLLGLDGKKRDDLLTVKDVGYLKYDGNVFEFISTDSRKTYYNKDGQVWTDRNTFNLSESAKVEEERFLDDKNNIRYPVVKGLKDKAVEDSINRQLKEIFVETKIYDGFEYYISEYRANRMNDMLIIEQVIDIKNDRYESEIFGKVYNIDLRNGNFYKLEDLFIKDSDYKYVLDDIIRGKAEMEGSYDLTDWEGIKENQSFIVQRDILDIYFDSTEMLNYNGPFSKFTIRNSEIEDILDLNGKFWWAISVSEGF